MAKRYTTDEVVAMMSAPSPNVEMLEQPASPFLDPAQINAAERELSQPPPEYPRPETVGTAITDAAGMDRHAAGSSGNMALQNYEAQEAFPIDQTPAPQRPAGGSQALYPSAEETKPSLPKQRYTTDEVMSLYMQQSKPRYSTKDVMLKMVQPLDDPTMPRLGRDEYFKAKEIKKSLQESGDLPSNWEETKTAVGGFLLTVPDAFATALYKTDKSQGWFEIGGAGFNPALALSETWRRSPATLAYSSEMARQGYAGMAEGLRVMGGPKYRVAETGEFVMDEEESAGGQFGQIDPRNIVDRYKAKGLTLRPVNDEDKKDFEYQQWNKKMDRDLQVERARTAEMPPEFAYRMLVGSAAAVSDYNTGRNDFANITGNVGPMQSQAVVGSMLVDPLTYTTFGAAATRIGISAAAKGATARSLDIIGRAVNKAVKPAEVPLTQIDRFRKMVMPPAKVAGAYGLAAGAAYAADVMQLPPELKTAAYTAASLYTAYRGGLGVLRFVGKRFPEASVILRESADPTNGLDLAARKVVASNPNVPSNVRARLERPSQFLSMESTPQRLSQNMALSPGTRKMMEKLSNWYVVQGVRGASDVATGAVKGAIVAAPFAELTRLGGDERAADAMHGIGPALGAFGGAANRVFGAGSRTIGRAESDIGRMLVDVQAGNTELRSKIGADGKAALQSWNFYNSEIGRMLTDVELAAGDVDALVKNRSFDELARIAAMQGFFRSRVDYIPLGAADFALNADQHGADGSAGFFLSVPDSERARIFVNVDARRADVEPHEFGEAFFSTGAFSPEQMAAMRSGVDARYGLDGVQKRANEYAESLIKASNATNFPNEKLVVSAEQIQAKVNELAQAELQRGGNDPLDWVRREIMVEEWRMAGMDFASIRRNIPEGANPVTFIEDVLGANARALGLSGVRVDPETGIPITPEQLFRENPVAADDPVVMSNLKAYTKAYRAWLNDPAHEVPSGVKIAPDGRAESLANNPNVIFDANGQNPLATRDPQTGQVRWKNDKDRAKEAKVRGQQIRNVAGRDLVAPGSPQFGPKKTANGRIRISGRRLPAALELQNHWKPQLDKIRRLEALADGDESTQVLYVAMGNSADKVKTSRPQDIVAINREMVFDEWVVQGKNNDLYGQFLDLTTIRNRAMRAISERNPALDPANGGPGYSLQAIMDDVYQWMADKRANKDGAATIGADRKNVVNALINPGTNLNREKNPIAGAFGRGSAIKTLLVDNIMAVSGTGRKGAAMDYNWANGNFMPNKPAPRPDMDGDLAPPRAQMMADKAPDTNQQTIVQRNPSGEYEALGMLKRQGNGKWAVYTPPMMTTNKEGAQIMLPPSKLAEYPTEAKARARAEKEFFTSLPLQDSKQYLGPREQKAITEAQRRIAEVAKNNPEAARLEVTRDDRGLPKVGLIEDADGNPVLDERGNQKFGAIYRKAKYGLREAPGLSKDEAKAVQQAADLMEADARRGQANPAIANGIGWYGRMRGWLQQAYGATIERFGQLLGATSARTPVDTNFIQAREALQLFGRGAYDDLLQRFDAFVMQKKADADSGRMEAEWRKRGGKGTFKLEDEYRKQINSFKEVPLRANGKKYNANSTKVLHALYGNWIAQTKGPKTPNFAGNLTGRTFKATIDVWAARNLRRLLYANKTKRWRILPEQEQGVTDADFFFAQKVYDEVGRRMGIPTDDLQALQWFNEKDVWEANGWTDKTGAEKSSFDKEAGKLNLDRYQVGLTTFQDASNFDPAVQRAELTAFRDIIRAQEGLEAARVTESDGLYGDVIEPTFDAEFSVNRKGEASPSIEPIVRQAIDTANRNRQKDVFISAVVNEAHPNARPMVEVGFKNAASKAEIDAVTAVFRGAGIDGFTVARNERGDVLGIRAQYVPEISARYDTLDHLDPAQFAVRADKWMDMARNAIASLENQDNVSYRKEGHVSTNVYGIEEYGSVTPADILRSSASQELGRRRAILEAGAR